MAQSVGFTFSIGARLQAGVASVFDTVAGRAGKLKREMKQLSAVSGAAGKLTSTRATVDSLRAEAAAGKDVAKQLAAAQKAYASAQRSAAKYNITVKDAASVHAKATAQMKRTESALQRQETYQRNAAKRAELQGRIMGTVASTAAVALPVKMAIDFESAMADAAKTIDGMRDKAGNLTPEYYKMEAAVKQMGRELPLTHEEIAKLFAAGGQMGMSDVEKLREFTTLSAHMAVAFGMGTEEAAEAIGGYQTKLGLTTGQTREMLDLINQFANTSSATEKDVAGIVGRVGALGDVAGIAHKPMTAMAATLASMKIPEEIAATGLKNFMLALSKGEAATKKQKEAFASLSIDAEMLGIGMQRDAEGAMLSVLKAIQKLPKHKQVAALSELFGSESLGAIAPLLTQLDLLEKNLLIAADKTQYAGAMQQEFANRSRTTATALLLLKNRSGELGIHLGSALLPAVVAGANAFGRFLEPVVAYANANPTVVNGAFALVAGLVAVRLAALAGGFGLAALSNACTLGRAAVTPLVWMTNALTTATFRQSVATRATAVGQRLLNVAMRANPIGIIITAVTALVGWFAYLFNETGSVSGALGAMWDGCVAGLKLLTRPLEWALNGIGRIVAWLGSDEAEETDGKVRDGLAEMEKEPAPAATPAARPRPVSAASPPVSTRPSALPSPEAYDQAQAQAAALQVAEASGKAGFAGPRGAGSPGGGAVTLAPSFNFKMDGVPDREFGKRVLDSLESEKTAVQRFLSGLLADAARVHYG